MPPAGTSAPPMALFPVQSLDEKGDVMPSINRRVALSGALAMAASGLAAPGAMAAEGETEGTALTKPAPLTQAPGYYRYKIGSLTVTALHDGFAMRPLDSGFVRNAPLDQVKAALAEAFLPADTVPITFTALLIDTGRQRILIDTGTGGLAGATSGQLQANLAAAGIAPDSIQAVVISHFHGDHINGLKTKDGALAFGKAEVLVPQPEWDYWMDDGTMSRAPKALEGNFQNARRVFGDMGDRVKRFEWGQEIASDLTAVAAPGHTPGHTAFHLASGTDQLLVLSDTAHLPALFVRHPDWSVVFEMDPETARESRRKLLDRAAVDRARVAGFHFPFPANGYIQRDGTNFRFVPVPWSAQI
jgi:glyoxylase-like metal-dependent hydrolase (beta-lactamase superfamily II)